MRAPSTYQGIAAFAVAAALVLVCMSSAKHFSPLGGLAVIVPILPGNISPLALFSRMGSAPILRARIGVTHMATTPANRAVENGLSAQERKQRRSDSRRDSTIVIIGVLTIIVAAIAAAITAFMG